MAHFSKTKAQDIKIKVSSRFPPPTKPWLNIKIINTTNRKAPWTLDMSAMWNVYSTANGSPDTSAIYVLIIFFFLSGMDPDLGGGLPLPCLEVPFAPPLMYVLPQPCQQALNFNCAGSKGFCMVPLPMPGSHLQLLSTPSRWILSAMAHTNTLADNGAHQDNQ